MAINIPSKTGKKRSILLDALRILAWEDYRSVNKEEIKLKKLKFGGYEMFEEEWKADDIHNMTYPELLDFVKGLEFTEGELINMRANYYAKKAKSNAMAKMENQAISNNQRGNYADRLQNGQNGHVEEHEFDVSELF
ncbi:hypothetical protein [Microcoleus sp. B3-D7]|uniref:hypothetical protein n=1 Tax=Microcoleus sp. B3-D7 TaxID=2818659 RepID=UPI002FD0ECC3